jgi:hypothetical protein
MIDHHVIDQKGRGDALFALHGRLEGVADSGFNICSPASSNCGDGVSIGEAARDVLGAMRTPAQKNTKKTAARAIIALRKSMGNWLLLGFDRFFHPIYSKYRA